MKKLFAIVAMLGLFATTQAYAEEKAPEAVAASENVNPTENGADQAAADQNVELLKAEYSRLEALLADSSKMEAAELAATKLQLDSVKFQLDSIAAASEVVEEEVQVEAVSEGGIVGVHKGLKTKFIEGGPEFMALVSIALVIGLAFCIERIIYLSLAKVNAKKLMLKGCTSSATATIT